MRCPDCHQPISWVPSPGGRRVAITAHQDPNGEWFLDAKGVLRRYNKSFGDVPRYARHVPCPEAA